MKIKVQLNETEEAILLWLTMPFRLLNVLFWGICAGFEMAWCWLCGKELEGDSNEQ